MFTPAQLNWFVDPEPALLPVWLIALGLEAMFFGMVHQIVTNISGFKVISWFEKLVVTGGTAIGYLFLTISVLQTSYGQYAAFLYLLFRGVEGAAATHLYIRIYNFLQKKGFGGSLSARAKHYFSIAFVFSLGSYLIVKTIVGTPQIAGYQYTLEMAYTGSVAAVSMLAVRWRYRDLAADVHSGVIIGIAMCIAGAQIFSFTLTSDIILTIVGSIIYSLGFWGSAYLRWNSAIKSNVSSSI